MKTQQELQLHYWGPHYDMVKEYNAKHGTYIQLWECVKYENINTYTDHPPFRNDNTEDYTFAITILYDDKRKEHRPVFVGDRVYEKDTGDLCQISGYDTHSIDFSLMSWNEPAYKS